MYEAVGDRIHVENALLRHAKEWDLTLRLFTKCIDWPSANDSAAALNEPVGVMNKHNNLPRYGHGTILAPTAPPPIVGIAPPSPRFTAKKAHMVHRINANFLARNVHDSRS